MSNINFDKSFESLYKTAMTMADNCIGKKELENRFEKLEEEYQELVKEFDIYYRGGYSVNPPLRLKDELADVLFVLLHCSHKLGFTAFELLHIASSKMLARMNDPEYKAKN